MAKGKLYGVSVGPGDPELVTIKAVRTVKACPVVATPRTARGATVALDIMAQTVDLAGKTVLPLDFAMSRNPEVLEESHRVAAEAVMAELEAGRDVALLNLGDVSVYSTFTYIKELVEAAGYGVAVIPGVTSFCATAAALGVSLTANMNAPLHIVPAASDNLDEVLDMPGTKVIMKAGKPLSKVKEVLRAKGMYEKASLVQNCGMPDELVARSLDDAEDNGRYFTTMVVQP